MAKHHGINELPGLYQFCRRGYVQQEGDRFGRLFQLPPLYTDPVGLRRLGAKGGPMDGGAAAARTKTVDVGQVFFGQFVDHDITLDVTSSLSEVAVPSETPNVRTPTLDLDNIYGMGPEANPFLYHASGKFAGIKLLVGADGTAAKQDPKLAAKDLVRSSGGTAIIGDPRNDENRIISQMQLAVISFHNHVVDFVSQSEGLEGGELFERSRQLATWHYQWSVLNDFLVAMCGAAPVDDILGNGRRFYCAREGDPFIPVEFAVAAYRFGHSMVPQTIRIQKKGKVHDLFGKILGEGFAPLANLEAVVDWRELVTTKPRRPVQKAEQLDTKMASILLELPFIPAGDVRSLATRNLLRGQSFLLPSGEQVAAAVGRPQAEITKVSAEARKLAKPAVDLATGTPLWFYILTEGEVIGRETKDNKFDPGEGLGPVGARIVAEVLIGLVELDPRSYLGTNRNWDPSQGVGVATVGELLTFQP